MSMINSLKGLLDFAVENNIPELVSDVINIVGKIKDVAQNTPHILKEADAAELDQIHADALAASAKLDAAIDAQIEKQS